MTHLKRCILICDVYSQFKVCGRIVLNTGQHDTCVRSTLSEAFWFRIFHLSSLLTVSDELRKEFSNEHFLETC